MTTSGISGGFRSSLGDFKITSFVDFRQFIEVPGSFKGSRGIIIIRSSLGTLSYRVSLTRISVYIKSHKN